MRYAAVIFLSSFLLVSCKGDKGDKGDTGNANVQSYSGSVTSSNQLIFVTGGPSTHAIAASIGDGTNYTNLPFLRTGDGINAIYAFREGVVNLIDCDTTPTVRYRIFLIQKTSGSSASLSDRILERY